MSESTNTEIIQSAYEKFGNGDVAGILELLTDDVEWSIPTVTNAPFTGDRQGRDQVGEFFKQLDEGEEFTRFEPLEFIAQGEKVVVFGEVAATVKSTGRAYESDWVHVFHLRDGKVSEFQEFFDTAAAERAFAKTAAA